MEGKEFQPYIPADKVMPEFTATSIILGIILAIVFGGANAYLGLRVGMTVSASIPAAVVSMGVIRVIMKRDSILENNMVQTIGSAGEALAAGAIFVLPVLFMWASEGLTEMPNILELGLTTMVGGILGVAFMVPLRDSLIVEEHGTLPYPEGIACAEVLIAGEEGGAKASLVFRGLGLAALYKFAADGLQVFPGEVFTEIKAYKGAGIGTSVLPALAGVGYICGMKVASALFCGGMLSWLVIMPLIATFGTDLVLFPATVSIAELYETAGSYGLWSNYIRYIGAGAVMTGGIIGMIKIFPTLVKTFKKSLSTYGKNTGSELRTQQNLSMKTVSIIVVACTLAMWLLPFIPVNLFGALIIVVLGFIFDAVAARIVGTIGCNNNPASGMTIATLLIASLLYKITGQTDMKSMIGLVAIGCVVCSIVCVAPDTSQDLKTGFLVGATPRKQQIGELIGVMTSAMVIGAILFLMNSAWGYGSAELPAPTATLMRMVIEGVMGGNLPWNLILIGVFIAIIAEMFGIPGLTFGVGMYLPIPTSMAVMFGGIVRLIVDRKKYASEEEHKRCADNGVLYCSGLIAGEGVLGVVLALMAIIPMGSGRLADVLNLSGVLNIGQIGAIICFVLLLVRIYFAAAGGKKKADA